MGVKVKATNKAIIREKVTVTAIGPKTCPAIPPMKREGPNTQIWAKAAIKTAVPTSDVPILAAAWGSKPVCLARKILSKTTTKKSTRDPKAIAKLPKVIRLIESLSRYIRMKVARTEIGIATAITTVVLTNPKQPYYRSSFPYGFVIWRFPYRFSEQNKRSKYYPRDKIIAKKCDNNFHSNATLNFHKYILFLLLLIDLPTIGLLFDFQRYAILTLKD
jgi:hypothetical protein